MFGKSASSSDLPLEDIKNKPKLNTPLLSGSFDSDRPNYESNSPNPTVSLQQASKKNTATITLEWKTQSSSPHQTLDRLPNIVQEEHQYPDMHRYITKNKLEFTYDDILKHDEDETKILGDLFDIFKQEIHQENKEQNSNYSRIKKLYYPWMKWSWVDQLAEKILQSLIIWPTDLHSETKEKCKPVWKEERSILLSTVQGLEKANFVRGFVQGIELGLFKSVHYFIYAMLAYRFVSYFQSELVGFFEFKDIFNDSEQKGIDSFVRSLAKIDSIWLKLVLTTPLIIGFLKGLANINILGESDITMDRMMARKVTIKGIDANNIAGQNTYLEEIGPSSNEFAIEGLYTGEEDNRTSEIKMDEEEKVTVTKAKLKEMKADKLSSSAVTTFDEMTSINIEYEQEMTDTGMEMKAVKAKEVEAKKVNIAKGKLIAKSLTAKEMKMDKMSGSIEIVASKLKKIEFSAEEHIVEPGGFFRDVFQESVPVVSSLFSLSSNLQKLEFAVRWDGRLTVENRERAFEVIRNIAKNGKKVTQLNAMESLAKIAHGVGFKDLPRLKKAGYLSATLSLILYTKARALADLRFLTEAMTLDEKKEHDELKQTSKSIYEKAKDISKFMNIIPRRIYAYYLLWWLGHPMIWWNRPLFLSLKGAKLGLELYFLSKIIESIKEAINCPDKLGFELGFGYPEWATEFTVDCFYQLIENEFRTINLSDPVDQLVEQISLFHLTDLTQLKLSYRNLTGDEMVKILVAIEARGAKLAILKIYDNFADTDMKSLASYLKTSKIPTIRLGCQDNIFPGGTELTNQGLQYLIDVLPDTQIKQLVLCFPNIDSTGIIPLANQLNTTKVNQFFLLSSNIDDEGSQFLAPAFMSMPLLYQIILTSPKIGDGTIQALSSVVKKNPLLKGLWVTGDLITDIGAEDFAQMIQNSFLNVIGLESNNITDQGVVALTNSLQALPSLTNSLSIGSQCGEQGIIALAQQLNRTNFWALRLIGNSFTSVSMQAFSTALPSTIISELQLIGQQFNNQTMAQLAHGINSSLITILILDNCEFSGSISILASNIQKLKALQLHFCNLTSNDVIILASYLPGSTIEGLYLPDNKIGDAGIIALADALPHTKISILSLTSNNISDIGARALYNVYRSTRLQALFLDHNNVSSQLLSEIESIQWQAYCQDQLCHANIQYNNRGNGLQSQQLPKRNALLHDEDLLNHIYWPSTVEALPFQFASTLQNTTNEFVPSNLTPSTIGGAILGIVGFGILLYKNSTWIQFFTNMGSRFFQQCWNGKKTGKETASIPTHVEIPAFHRRYALFSYLLPSSAHQMSPLSSPDLSDSSLTTSWMRFPFANVSGSFSRSSSTSSASTDSLSY